jgi:hypothetical protein
MGVVSLVEIQQVPASVGKKEQFYGCSEGNEVCGVLCIGVAIGGVGEEGGDD